MRVTSELLNRYDRPGPRYTSYPTAVEFTSEFGPPAYEERLHRAAEVDAPLSLYVHLPFCEARCSFCACHVVVTPHQEVADAYLGRVKAEAALVAGHLGERRQLDQYHWGGGTPTYYPPDTLLDLHRSLLSHFELVPGAEVALEVDPRVTTTAHLEALRQAGFNRLSMGVQDFDPEVQDLIGRHQTWEQTADLFIAAREMGYDSINIDLIFGLPGQEEDSFERTIDRVLQLRPDRLAVYSFAFVPWVHPQQQRIPQETLPDRETKFALLAQTMAGFTGAGYTQIGMDHFALPDDELALARTNGTLSRNFMGYTTKRAADMVALGTSGISDVQGAYAQNHKRLASYYESMDARRLPILRGVALGEDDRIRRHVITELMCNGRIEAEDVTDRFGIAFADYFSSELEEMARAGGVVEEGLATIDDRGVEATELGAVFIRNVAMVFDAYLAAKEGSSPVFSRTL